MLNQPTTTLNIEALPLEVPESIEADVSALEIGGALRLEDLPQLEGVTFLDDPHETVIATVSAPIVEAEPEPEEGEELAEGEEPAEGERRGRGRRGRRGPRRESEPGTTPRRKCASSVGARAPRRWICSSSVSATRAASTRATGTTPAGWSSTSSPGGTAAPSVPSSRASSRRCASASCSSRC